MKFNCPACGKHLSVKDELAGKNAKCPKCGESVTIPAAGDAPAPTNACPRCSSELDAGAVFCVKCGFNLASGTTETTDTGPIAPAGPAGPTSMPRPSSGMMRSTPRADLFAPVKKIAAAGIVIVALALVWMVYRGGGGASLGVSGSRPVGAFKDLDAHLVGNGLVRQAATLPSPAGYPSDCKTYKYLDEAYAQRMGGKQEFVILVVNPSDAVLGVEGQYVRESALEDYKPRWRQTQRFLHGIWNEACGDEPDFVGDVIASPVFANHDDSRVTAEWAKMPEKISSFARVRIARASYPLAEMNNVTAPGGGVVSDKVSAIAARPITPAPGTPTTPPAAAKPDPFAWEHPTAEDAAMLKKFKADEASVPEMVTYAVSIFGMRRRLLLKDLKKIEQARIKGIQKGKLAELKASCVTLKKHLALSDAELRTLYPDAATSQPRKAVQAKYEADKAGHDALNQDIFIRVVILKGVFKKFGRDLEGSDQRARMRYRVAKPKWDRAQAAKAKK